jgi:phosphoribosylformylglycinamidine synthase subunit PurS
VRIGQIITLQLEAKNEAIARKEVEKAYSKLLANLIMEAYT